MLTRWNRAWSPFETLVDVRRELDRVFDEATQPRRGEDGGWFTLTTDVLETPDEIRAMVEVPGMKPEDVDITIDNNILTVSGEKKVTFDEGEEGSNYRVSERRYGRFQRSFVLPQNVDPDRVAAEYDHGVQTVRLPKKEEAKPRRIAVKPGSGARQVGSGES